MKNENFLVGIFKEVGKEPEFKKVENTIEALQELIGGEIATTDYENYTIIHNKNEESLKPNIWLNTGFLKIGATIKGKIFVALKGENNTFHSLNKNQAIKCREILIEKSFNNKNQLNENISKIDFPNGIHLVKIGGKNEKFSNEDVLKMILGIQTIILKFIKDNSN